MPCAKTGGKQLEIQKIFLEDTTNAEIKVSWF